MSQMISTIPRKRSDYTENENKCGLFHYRTIEDMEQEIIYLRTRVDIQKKMIDTLERREDNYLKEIELLKKENEGLTERYKLVASQVENREHSTTRKPFLTEEENSECYILGHEHLSNALGKEDHVYDAKQINYIIDADTLTTKVCCITDEENKFVGLNRLENIHKEKNIEFSSSVKPRKDKNAQVAEETQEYKTCLVKENEQMKSACSNMDIFKPVFNTGSTNDKLQEGSGKQTKHNVVHVQLVNASNFKAKAAADELQQTVRRKLALRKLTMKTTIRTAKFIEPNVTVLINCDFMARYYDSDQNRTVEKALHDFEGLTGKMALIIFHEKDEQGTLQEIKDIRDVPETLGRVFHVGHKNNVLENYLTNKIAADELADFIIKRL